MKNILFPLTLILIIPFLGCEKKIDLELPSAKPKLVVDGWFTNQADPYGQIPTQTVRLTMSSPYFNPNEFKAVQDATVLLKDNKGNSYPLTFKPAFIQKEDKMIEDKNKGQYELKIKLLEGISYTLYIRTADGKEYESTPQEVINYQLIPQIIYEYKDGEDSQFEDPGYYISFEPQFPDHGEYYFTWQLFKEDTFTSYDWSEQSNEQTYSYPWSEILWGSTVYTSVEESQTYFDIAANEQERYYIKQHVISKNAWDFMRMAQEQSDNEGTMFSTPPAPLRGNIKQVGGKNLDDNALGFFIISSVQITPTITIEHKQSGD